MPKCRSEERRVGKEGRYGLSAYDSSRRRHTRYWRDWSSDVCSSDLDPQLRLQIHTQKQTKVLQWLKTEIYSSSEILARVLGLNHRQSLHKLLMTMQEQGLIRYAKVQIGRASCRERG